MNLRNIRFPERRVIAGIAASVLVGVIGVSAVTAASPSPAGPSTSSGTSSGTGPNGPTALDARLARGRPVDGIRLTALRQAVGRNFRIDVTATGAAGTRNVLYVRGTLDVGPGSVTVTLPDKATATFGIDATTVVRDNGVTVAYADLVDGAAAIVVGTRDQDGSYTARLIRPIREVADTSTPTAGATP